MGFQTGKRNVWTQKNEEIARLRAQIDQMREQPYVADFARRVGESIMLQLALKPFAQWPQEAKNAFNHERDQTEVSAELYRRRLPT